MLFMRNNRYPSLERAIREIVTRVGRGAFDVWPNPYVYLVSSAVYKSAPRDVDIVVIVDELLRKSYKYYSVIGLK